MAASSFGKRAREQAKQAKAAAKRERRLHVGSDPVEAEPDVDAADAVGSADLLEMIAALHRNFAAGVIGFEDFEARKTDLLARLPVD